MEYEALHCDSCGAERGKHRPLFSYEHTGEAFCNKDCFITWVFRGRQTNYRLKKIRDAARAQEAAQAQLAKSAARAKKPSTPKSGGARRGPLQAVS